MRIRLDLIFRLFRLDARQASKTCHFEISLNIRNIVYRKLTWVFDYEILGTI